MTTATGIHTSARPAVDLEHRAPAANRAMAAFSRAAGDLPLDPRLAELVRVRVSQLNGCAYCLDMHTKDARALGETEQRLYALAAWREAPYYSSAERAALALAEAMTLLPAGPPSDDVLTDAEIELGGDGLAAVTWAIVVINAWNRVAIASRLEPGSYRP